MTALYNAYVAYENQVYFVLVCLFGMALALVLGWYVMPLLFSKQYRRFVRYFVLGWMGIIYAVLMVGFLGAV